MPKKSRSQPIGPLLVIGAGAIVLIVAILLLVKANTSSTAATSVPSKTSSDGVQRISLEEAKKALDNKQAVFVDVRDPDSFKIGHIKGAVLIPLLELETRYTQLKSNQWIITYCTWPNEETSARAAQVLTGKGFTRVNALLGGYAAWYNAKYPTESD